jgi:hypothetical protein
VFLCYCHKEADSINEKLSKKLAKIKNNFKSQLYEVAKPMSIWTRRKKEDTPDADFLKPREATRKRFASEVFNSLMKPLHNNNFQLSYFLRPCLLKPLKLKLGTQKNVDQAIIKFFAGADISAEK